MNLNVDSMEIVELGQPLVHNKKTLPSPAPGDVTIKVAACSLNFADVLMCEGKYQEKFPLPFSPGLEMSGVVTALGDNVTNFRIGQKVVSYCGHGGLATGINVSADHVMPLPDDADLAIQAAVPIAYGTAHLALDHRAKLKASENLLVLGASGGVGLTAIEIGKLMGARIIACARGPEKLEIARHAGANFLIDSETDDIKSAVKELGGADVVFDPVGGEQFAAALRCVNPEARLLPLGFASGNIPQIPANILLVKNISVLGFYWGGYRTFAPEVMNKSQKQLIEWAHGGKIKPHISHRLPLRKANEALDLLRNRKSTGKVVVEMP